MQQISDLLGARAPEEPEQMQKIKQFVKDTLGFTPRVQQSSSGFTVLVPSSAEAMQLRFQTVALKTACDLGKHKLFIRIAPES